MQKSSVFGRVVRIPEGKRACGVRRCDFQGARWEDLVEIYASSSPEVEQAWPDFADPTACKSHRCWSGVEAANV